MTIKDVIQNWKDKKQKFKDMDSEQRHIYLREQKKISPEERELNRYNEERRQERIKEQVKRIRQQRTREDLTSNKHNLLYAKNIMVGHKKIFSTDNIFSSKKMKGGFKK